MIASGDSGLMLEGTRSELIDDMCNVCYAMLTKDVLTTDEFLRFIALVLTRYQHPEEFEELEKTIREEEASA